METIGKGGVWLGTVLLLPLHAAGDARQLLGRGFPSRLRASVSPPPGRKGQLGLGFAPPLEVKDDSHPNCTLETKRGEKKNEEKLDREKKTKKSEQ